MNDMLNIFDKLLQSLKIRKQIRVKIGLSFTLVIRFLPILFLEWREFETSYKLKGGKKNFLF